ncbi:hypothetical protein BJ912DRAFT_1011751 [Pholiota molesta]|nr:hypothetical protein BJ912DRAFT_1011751 [Pholiota molesta]
MPRKFGIAAKSRLQIFFRKARDMRIRFWRHAEFGRLGTYGIRDLHAADHPDMKGVTLKCPRTHKAATYRDPDPIGSPRVFDDFANFVKKVPTHLIYGQIE